MAVFTGVPVVCLVLFLSANFLTASAYRSLSHIETIKQTESVFTVLEVVPKSGSGSVGYYAQGQEPTSDWLSRAAAIGPSAGVTGPDARKAWVNSLFQNLRANGLLSDGATTPLTAAAPYAEAFPWSNNGSPAGTQLFLTDQRGNLRQESTLVRGSFQFQGVDGASFDQVSSPVLLEDGQSGTHVQHILQFSYATAQENGFYYYNPSFEAIDLNQIDAYIGKPLYITISPEDTTNPTYGSASPIEVKRYAGTLGQGGFALDREKSYFSLIKTGRPSAVWSAGTPYRAEADGFAEESNGYFNMTVSGYTFMDSGKGNYSFTPKEDAEAVSVLYDSVYVTGGYQNNNWFLEHVFDDRNARLAIRVYSVVPGETAPATLTNMLQKADLIVLSAGFDVSRGGASLADLYAGETNDLTAEQSAIVGQALQDGRPVWLDGRLKDGSCQINALAAQMMAGKSSAFVQGGLYCFLPDTSGVTRKALVTSDFFLPFDSGYATQGEPYFAVMDEISYENFLRSQSSGVDPLPTAVTMANCVRYIINYSGQRVQNVKDSIRILEVQPNAHASQLTKTLDQANSNYDSPYNVFRWLPTGSFDSVADVNITTMSTSEFIGKIEDINEQYDLVYIGDSTAGFYLENDWPVYNDPKLKGKLYSNIGDLYESNLRLTGLLDRDYSSYSGNVNTNASRTFRFSGNDITAKKETELKNFADSGFPVILAGNLVEAGSAATPASEFTAQALAIQTNGSVKLYAVPKLTNAIPGATYRYQWYSGKPSDDWNRSISGKTDSTYIPTTPGDYYCEIVLQTADASYSVYSNYITVEKSNWQVTSDDDPETKSPPFYPISIAKSAWYDDYYYVSVSGASVSAYQWYYRQNLNKSWTPMGNTNSDRFYFDDKDYYMCRVTIGGQQYYSPQIYKQNSWSYPVSNFTGTYSTTTATLSLGITYAIGENGATFTGAATVTPSVFSRSINYNWYGDNGYLNSGTTSGPLKDGTYYCVVKCAGNSLESGRYTVSSGFSGTVKDGGTKRMIPGKAAVASAISAERIDNSSILYGTLSDILSKPNVMPVSEAMGQRETVLKYLNLSKPSIDFRSKPRDYDGNRTQSLVSGQTLSYSFQILNPTDSTPTSTRYACKLYLDQNADGRYVSDEELTDLVITTQDGKQLVDADALMASTASGSVTYTVKRTLPDSFSGIIPWKLEIVKVGAKQIHASETGYTYIRPAMQTLRILQISSLSGGGGTRFSLEAQNNNKSSTYGALFDELRGDGLYDLQIQSRSVSQINGTDWTLNASELAFDANKNRKLDTQSELYNYLSSFDMLIIGFGDGYGYKETQDGLSEMGAKAVVQYIDSKKAVLFTHDTTSFVNLPESYKTSSIYKDQWYWGYYFNSVVRSAVGLDRYGVTDPVYGVSRYSPINNKSQSGPVANAYSGFDSTLAKKLTDAGYSIAYKPGDGGATTVPETQGYTALTLLRYSNNRAGQQTPLKTVSCPTSESSTEVTTVSQVNRGQITTFPYNLNTADFGGTRAALTVGKTHEQYYQLNMNSDDIVVWYCLSGSRFDYMENDVINNYYIYNRGNVTYSGAGHRPDEVTRDEAKLFVNTMIAAYRAAAVNPTVQFTSSNASPMDSFFLSTEYTSSDANNYSGNILVNAGHSEERAVYFTINDPNLATGKKTAVELYCEDASGSDVLIGDETVKASALSDVQIYQVSNSTETAVANAALRSGILYKIYLPDSLLTRFGNSPGASMKIYIRAVTTIDQASYIGSNTLTLRKLGLLSLC
ncbi:DUF5057 domain-containing protein [Oscillibacter sp.]|uniref:DUF5057 domain-containing protein n=1 Tax=Oscillibacter sp. TaxID=1945593 RepID=UPI002613029F|nr:DUF5057 domain-containing protein [Oscillibacter sp.]MDD3347401.1 DUF5057 domain-containing protein [Oscillibacter sp.]